MTQSMTERKSYHVMEATDRPPVEVAVGVLIERDAHGREARFLLTSRPEGKVYAGYWEFPGGKLEAGETVEQAAGEFNRYRAAPILIGDSRVSALRIGGRFPIGGSQEFLSVLQLSLPIRAVNGEDGSVMLLYRDEPDGADIMAAPSE